LRAALEESNLRSQLGLDAQLGEALMLKCCEGTAHDEVVGLPEFYQRIGGRSFLLQLLFDYRARAIVEQGCGKEAVHRMPYPISLENGIGIVLEYRARRVDRPEEAVCVRFEDALLHSSLCQGNGVLMPFDLELWGLRWAFEQEEARRKAHEKGD
jgi:hypothetical protein